MSNEPHCIATNILYDFKRTVVATRKKAVAHRQQHARQNVVLKQGFINVEVDELQKQDIYIYIYIYIYIKNE